MSKPVRTKSPSTVAAAPAGNRQALLFIAAAVLLVAVFVAAAMFYNHQQAERSRAAAAHNVSMLVRPHAPTLGRADAKVHIVEFLDPACETCRTFYPFVKRLMAANPDKIRLSVRHVPFHPGSDEVVLMLEAARRQGKYWETLETVLASQPRWAINHQADAQRVWPQLAGLGLDFERMRADMRDPALARAVAQDLSDAKALNVTKTPEYFVNGRPLPSFGYEQLETLVKEALADAY